MSKRKDTITKVGEEDGRRPDIRPQRTAPTQRVGATGTAIFAGHVENLEDDSRLTGRERYKTFSETLANVAVVAAGVRFFLNMVAKAEWKVVPAEMESEADTTRAEELASQVDDILNDMETPWHRIVRRAAMYRFYGFGIQEWTAKNREDGTVGFFDVEPRPQVTIERWDTDKFGTVLGVVQRIQQTQEAVNIPREKIVYLVDDSLSDSPEGLGLFRHIIRPAQRLQRYEQLEGFGYELDLRGVPIARAPITELNQMVEDETMTAEERDALLKPLKDFITNHIKNPALGLLIDSATYTTTDERQTPSSSFQYDMTLLDGGSYSLQEIAAAIRRVSLEIARVLGVEHLLLGDDSGRGSFALSKDKSNNFALIVDSTLKELREAFQKDLLDPLWLLNGWPEELKPTLLTDTTAVRDVEQLSAAIRDLASAGVVLDREDPAVAEFFELLGLTPLVGSLMQDPEMDLGGGGGQPAPQDDMPEDPEEELNEDQ